MTTNADIQDALDVWKKLYSQNGAVPKVIKANQDWLAALEKFLEKQPEDRTFGENGEKTVQQVLDELTFLRFADRKLDGCFSQIDTSSESIENKLSDLLKETEAYLFMTKESYELLINLGPQEDVPKEAPDAAQKARKNLAKVVKDHSTLISRPVEAELRGPATGTEILPEDQPFLEYMSGTELDQTRKLLLAKEKFELNTDEIDNLTNSWGKAIKKAVSELSPLPLSSLLSSLFLLHNTLEKLYELLATIVTRKDADILSIDI